jgi:hypothetical protein
VEPLLSQFAAHLRGLTAATSARAAEPGVTPADAVWLEEQHASQRVSLELITRMQALLRAVAAGNGGAPAYIAAAGMLMEFMVSHMLTLLTCFGTRRTWMAALGGDGDGVDAADAAHAARKPLILVQELPMPPTAALCYATAAAC